MMDTELKQRIIDLEILLTKPKVRVSVTKLERLLAKGFLELTSTGLSYGKAQALANLPNENSFHVTTSDFVFRKLDKNIVLLSYKAIIKKSNGDNVRYSLRSSIWKKNDCGWQMEFHQGTPCQPF